MSPFPSFKAEAGNYIFAKETLQGWVPLYAGETEDLSDRFDNHHKWDACIKKGATAIHAHLNNGGGTARRTEESDIIARWNPACNG